MLDRPEHGRGIGLGCYGRISGALSRKLLQSVRDSAHYSNVLPLMARQEKLHGRTKEQHLFSQRRPFVSESLRPSCPLATSSRTMLKSSSNFTLSLLYAVFSLSMLPLISARTIANPEPNCSAPHAVSSDSFTQAALLKVF